VVGGSWLLARNATTNHHVSLSLLSAFFGVPIVTLRPPPLLARKPREHDEDPDKPKQREECDASNSPIDCAKYIETQANQTGSAKDTVDPRVNSHKLIPVCLSNGPYKLNRAGFSQIGPNLLGGDHPVTSNLFGRCPSYSVSQRNWPHRM